MVNEGGKDDFENEDDLFSNPDEQDDEYQFDQENEDSGANVDDEYDVDDDEDDEEDDEDEEDNESLVSKVEKAINHFMKMVTEEEPKKVLLPIALGVFAFIVVIVGFVKFIGLFTAHSDEDLLASADKKPAVTAPASTPAPTAEPVLAEKPPVADESHEKHKEPSEDTSPKLAKAHQELLQQTVAAQSASDKRLLTLQGNYENVVQQLNQLSQQTAQNAAQINNIGRNIQMLESQMMKLNNVLLDLLKEAKADKETAEAHAAQPIKGAMMNGSVEVVGYYIQAIIPGRAWLKDSNGKIFTVANGDDIPGYGRVISIEPKQGMVRTDQGKVIEYGIDQF